jgi:hypothetical protein
VIPTWLKTQLETAAGAALGARHAKPNLCRRCTTWTLVGLDADTLAFTARADPTNLTPAGELAALLGGRGTYTLTRTGNHHDLDDRDTHRITGRPPAASSARYAVLPAHRCGQPFTGPLAAPWPAALTSAAPSPTADLIPF